MTKVTLKLFLLLNLCNEIYKSLMIMKQNIGNIDKVIRILATVVLGVLYYLNLISGTVAIILLILAGIFILTTFLGTCFLYLPFGISTKKKRS